MSSLYHEPRRGRDLERYGRDPERDERHFDDYGHGNSDEDHHTHYHRRHGLPLVVVDPPDEMTVCRYQHPRERARSQSVRRDGRSESPHRRYRSHSASSARAPDHLGVPAPRHQRSKNERATEKAITAAAAAAFRVRNDPGNWAGEKGLRVAGAAVAAAAIDALLDADRHKHPLQHIAVSMVQGVVLDKMTDGGLHL